MNTRELVDCLKQDSAVRATLLPPGVFPADRLPVPSSVADFPFCFIANLDPSTDGGSHWVALYADGRGIFDYFCSYGVPPPPRFVSYMAEFSGGKPVYNANTRPLQCPLTTVCGEFCLYFLHFRNCRLNMEEIVNTKFSKRDPHENVSLVQKFVATMFSFRNPAIDPDLLVEQVSKNMPSVL